MKNKSKNRMTGNCKKTQQASNQDLPLQNHDLHDQSIKDQAEPDPELLIDTEPELSSQMEFEKVLSQSKNKYVTHDNILYRYYFEVGRYPLLTAEEEKEYGLAAKSGDFEAWSRLFKGNLRLVIMIAQRYQNQGVELQDLISEGNLGVMHAVRKFEPEKGFRFSTYAVWWIRHYLSNAIMNNGRTIRIPIHVNKAIARLLAVQKSLSQQLKRKPTVKELAMETGQTISEVMHLMTNHESTLSLDAALGTDQGVVIFIILSQTRR